MSQGRCKYEDMLFNYQTTSRSDYRYKEIQAVEPTVYKAKPKAARSKYERIKDQHTMTSWHGPVPFSLYHKQKQITRTNPRIIQQPYFATIDWEKRKEVIQTRPRIIMTPALAMDGLADKKRDILCNDIYTSTAQKAMEEGVSLANSLNVRAPLPGRKADANPITLRKYNPPYVPLEWRMESLQWDQRQLRAYCDSNKEFWLRRPKPQCYVCEQTAVIKNRTKINPTGK